MKSKLIYSLSVFIISIAMIAISCTDEEDINSANNTGRTEDKAEYELHIGNSDGSIVTLIGEDLEGSNWDPDTGYIYLNTDKNNEPLGTLTLTINSNIADCATVESAILSTSDVQVGTAAQINGKLYMQVPAESCGGICIEEIGSNFIYARSICIKMEESQTGEIITLEGWFIAVSP